MNAAVTQAVQAKDEAKAAAQKLEKNSGNILVGKYETTTVDGKKVPTVTFTLGLN